MRDEEPIVDVIDSMPWNNKHMEESAEQKSRVYRWVKERISDPGVKTYTPGKHPVFSIQDMTEVIVEMWVTQRERARDRSSHLYTEDTCKVLSSPHLHIGPWQWLC